MIYIIDKRLKKLPYISTAKAGSFTAIFGKMFEHMQEWKKEGKIKHIVISFHDSADVLDLILNEIQKSKQFKLP